MFVTGQNGVIKLKLVSSVDKSIKPPPTLLGFFLMGWLQGEGVSGGCLVAVWVWGFLLTLRELFGWKAAAKRGDVPTKGGQGGWRHLSSALRWGGKGLAFLQVLHLASRYVVQTSRGSPWIRSYSCAFGSPTSPKCSLMATACSSHHHRGL